MQQYQMMGGSSCNSIGMDGAHVQYGAGLDGKAGRQAGVMSFFPLEAVAFSLFLRRAYLLKLLFGMYGDAVWCHHERESSKQLQRSDVLFLCSLFSSLRAVSLTCEFCASTGL